MHIESGSTGERRTRITIFLVMFAGFAAWFGYDGLRGYPSANLNTVVKAMPEKPAEPKTNPQVTVESLTQLADRAAAQSVSRKDMHDSLGEPALDQLKEWTFMGTDIAATIRLSDGKAVSVSSVPISKPESPNFRIRPERVARIQVGMAEAEIKRELGDPSTVQERTLWYVGPAAFAKFQIADDKVVGKPDVHFKDLEHSESDIFMQKVFMFGLAGGALLVAVKLIQVLRLRAVLDDTGLTLKGRQVAWDAMTDLKSDEYARKGWVDLQYTQNGSPRSLRLDSYHINRFKDIVQAICERKGFALPVVPVVQDDPPDQV